MYSLSKYSLSKYFILASLCLLLSSSSLAQSTTVSGQVTDSGAQAWNNGTYTFQFIPNNNFPSSTYSWTGGVLNQTISGSLNATGGYSQSIPSNTSITPSGSQWRLQVCSGTNPVNCFTVTQTITGGSQTVNATPPAIVVPPGAGNTAYVTAEVSPAIVGSQIYIIGTGLQLCSTVSGGVCTVWTGGSSSSSSPSFANFSYKYFGIAPDDCGNAGCSTPVSPAIRYLKFCYDGVVTGQPTTTFKSLGTATITNTVLSSNVATYTMSAAAPFGSGELITVTGSTNGGGVFNITNQPILNYATGATTFTVAITNANVGTAGDTGTATGSCANFVSADATSTGEILVGGLASALDVSTTISAVTSASQVTLGANATTNATGKKFWYGTDATVPLQNWKNAINAGIPTATGLQTHSGYLPGMYLTTKPLRFINPLGAFSGATPICVGVTGGGYGTPEPWNLDNANESLSIWGQGAYRSGIVAGSQFNWATDGTANNTGVFYFGCWNGPTIQNFAVLSGDYGIAYNTSTLTGKFGGFFDDANGHVNVSGMEIENFHNTTSNLVGDQMFNGTFESVRNAIQVYNNDCAGVYGGNATGVNLRGLSWNGYVWGGTRGSGCNPAAAVVFGNAAGGLFNSLHITNFILDNESGSADMPAGNGLINFANDAGLGMDDNDEFQFENGRIQTGTQNNFAVSVNATRGKLKASFTNVNLVNTNGAAAATTQLVLLQNANSDFNFFGGSLGVTGTAANCISNATGSVIHTHGTRVFGTCGIVGAGAAAVSQMTPSATGWSGRGSWSASALTAVGTLSVTGTGACATITTTSGGAWAGQLTCTGVTGASTLIITPGITATNGWSCFASDQTTAANTLRQSANAATTCTIAGTVNQNDVLTFGAVGF